MSDRVTKWEQAREALRASQVLLEESLYRDCVSRAYYAMFDAAQAFLNSEGHEAKTHKGVLVLLDKHFVKKGHIPAELTQSLRQTFEARQLADYGEDPVPPSDAEEIVHRAERFLKQIRTHKGRK